MSSANQAELHAAGFHLFLCIPGQRLTQFRQNPVSRVNQDDVQLVWIQVWIVGQDTAGEVVNRPSQLDSSKSAAGNYEAEEGRPLRCIGLYSVNGFTKKMPAFVTTASIEPNFLIASSATFCAVSK
jgi:hypothetical protein